MRALIIVDSTNTAGTPETLVAINACHSVGIKTQLQFSNATMPTVTSLDSRTDFDLIVIPWLESGNFAALARLYDGSLTKPVIVIGNVAANANLKGTDGSSNLGDAVKNLAKFSDNNDTFVHNQKWYGLDETLVAPEIVTPIIESVDSYSGIRGLSAWKYTPDGTTYVYHSKTAASRQGLFHLLLQEAVNDGLIAAPPKRAPVFLMHDHLNARGENSVGGFVENPALVTQYGDWLRTNNAICYANFEERYSAGSLGDVTTGTLLANMLEYADVFKMCACHDHDTAYMTESNSPDDPRENSAGKPAMDVSYQATKADMESKGFTVSTDLAHFANNLMPADWLELGSPDVSYRSSPDNATEQAGYGFKFARCGTVNQSYPSVHNIFTGTTVPCHHFMEARCRQRGITIIPVLDGDNAATAANTTTQIVTDAIHDSTLFMHFAINTGLFFYWHPVAFEDVAWRTANVAGAPTTASDGASTSTHVFDALERMANLARRCPDTINLGADVNDYT